VIVVCFVIRGLALACMKCDEVGVVMLATSL
jgi:hypothetical protein